jgi:hypothetical protein
MVTNEIARKTGRGLAMMTAVVAVVAFTAAPGTANAKDWRYGHHHHHGGWGNGGVALGILGGALAGAAIASATNPYYYAPTPYYAPAPYTYPYTYAYPAPPYYGY